MVNILLLNKKIMVSRVASYIQKRNTMKKASYIFGLLRQLLHSQEFSIDCKITTEFFSRNRVLSFPVIVLFILKLLTMRIPKEIDSFSYYCRIEEISRSAVTQARAKLSPFVFVKLNNPLFIEFYSDNKMKTLFDLNVRLPILGSGNSLK